MDSAHVSTSERRRAVRRLDLGFTLVEIIVVLVIVAVLMAIAVSGFGGTRHEARRTLVRTAAQSYSEAVEAFALDHAGRVPKFATADWPRPASGPVQPNSARRAASTYLGSSVPDPVSSGTVNVTDTSPVGGSETPNAKIMGTIVIRTQAPVPPATASTQFRIEAWMVGSDRRYEAQMTCYLGNWSPGEGVDRCA